MTAAKELLYNINRVILNPLITLAFAVAFLIFFWGIFQFVNSETSEKARVAGKRKIVYGLVGMLVMFSAYGLLNLVLTTFGIPKPSFLF